ncbi:ABC transporter permease [Puia dinghuensis]|nr:ABC transporter permease [Puia dinghuensis]
MLRHYIRIALRNLAKQKILTFVNVAGLSLGMACFSLILLFAVSEFSFDKFNKRAGQIYRVEERYTRDDGREAGIGELGVALAPAMKKAFPDVEEAVRLSNGRKMYMGGYNDVVQLNMVYADPGFLSMFSFPLLYGNKKALQDPYAVVITRSRARQLFGTEDAVGKTLPIKTDSEFHLFSVTAVAEDMPLNTSISFDVLGNYQYLEITDTDRVTSSAHWTRTYGDQTFVLLRPGSRLPQQRESLLKFRLPHFPEEVDAWRKTKRMPARYVLQPLLSLHTDTSVDGGSDTVDPKNIWILLGIAAGIVLIASINFTTLAIARSAGRAREVGVRKVVGGLRRQLIAQFLTESVLLSVLSSFLGWLLASALLPWFSQLAGRPLEFTTSLFPQLSWMLAGLTLLVGVLAGSYPALVLSGFNTVEVLKAKIRLGGSNLFTRSLVTVQFVLSIGLIIATVVMLRQVNYLRTKDLGLIKENTIVVHTRNIDATAAYPLFRQTLASRNEVLGVAASAIGLGEGQGQMGGMYDFSGKLAGVIEYPVDENFLPVMGLQLIAGRNFDRSITSDTVSNIIVNETLVHADLGLEPQQAIGQQIKTGVPPGSHAPLQYKTIIGVVRDFNFEPLNKKVRAQLFEMPVRFKPACFFVHLRAGDPTPVLDKMAATWKTISPDIPFSYSFLDEDLDRFYKSETRWGNIIACAGGISIFLACMGLFGLASLSAANRVKEIGIRKILGATAADIVGLLTGGFLRLVVLAAVIASPIAWMIMNRWLRDFAYRIDVGWWVFGVTALMAMGIAFLTIGLQAFRTARANPVKSLRVE